MEQLNKIELRGSVGYVRLQSISGKKVLHLSVATNYVYKGRSGEPVIETTWHNVSVWESKGMPDFSAVEKGSKVHIIGRLRSQRYTDVDGVERTAYDVLASQFVLIEDQPQLQYQFNG